MTSTVTPKATDPDGNAVTLTTEITSSTSAGATVVTSCTSGTVASCAAGTCVVPAGKLADNTVYYMHTKAADDQGLYNATYSAFTKFSTTKAAPAGPRSAARAHTATGRGSIPWPPRA